MAVLTEEQSILRDTASEWIKQNAPVSALRALRDNGKGAGFDKKLAGEIAAMGWTGMMVPEKFGGSEFGLFGLSLVLEQMGRTLVASPLISSALAAATAINTAGTEEQKSAWLPGIASGDLVGAIAFDEGPRHQPEKVATTARRDGDKYVLSGSKAFVAEGMEANLFIVSARTAGDATATDGITLFLVPAEAAGLKRSRRAIADSRGYAELTLADVSLPASAVLGDVGKGFALIDSVLDHARAGACAEMLGLASQAFEVTLDYMKTRVQFGQTIGTFQALQHRAAEMFQQIELTRSCVEAALKAVEAGASDAAMMVSAAKSKSSDLVLLISREMIQLHGGIGMTDAHDAGFYYKRARALDTAFGNGAYHRERYARLAGF